MPWQLVIVAALGASVGSFLNVVSLRYAGRPQLLDRSRCPHCGRKLRWWELVPILSFLALRARCAGCHASIAWQYPLVEAGSALLWLWIFSPFPATSQALLTAAITGAIVSTLLVLLLIDRRLMVLPDLYLVYLGIFVILRLAVSPPAFPADHLTGLVIGAGSLLGLWAITGGQGIGFGDIKLMLPLGLLLGAFATILLLFLAFIVGGAFAAYLLLSRRATLKTAVPFGPYLIAAAAALVLVPTLPQLLFAVVW